MNKEQDKVHKDLCLAMILADSPKDGVQSFCKEVLKENEEEAGFIFSIMEKVCPSWKSKEDVCIVSTFALALALDLMNKERINNDSD